MTGEPLTPAEHDAVAMAGELWGLLTGIVGDGPARESDLRELIGHIHAIQQAVLKQAAARAYPDLYRLLGGHPAGTPESAAQIRRPVIWNHEQGDQRCPGCHPLPPDRPDPLPDPTARPDDLPLSCRLRGHGRWRPRSFRGGWWRPTCDRCRHLDLPTP